MSGWGTLGYALGGGAIADNLRQDDKVEADNRLKKEQLELDKKTREQNNLVANKRLELQKMQYDLAASTSAIANKHTEKRIEALALQNQELAAKVEQTTLHNHVVNSYMAGKDLDDATKELISNNDYERFNRTIKNNPILQDKFKELYNTEYIRPIDFNSDIDRRQLKALGVEPNLLDEQGIDGIRSNFYMTSNSELVSLPDFVKDTGYVKRMTTRELDNYVSTLDKLSKIGQKPTLNEIKAEDALQWLQANPDKNFIDYENLNRQEAAPSSASLKDEYVNLQVAAANGTLDKDNSVRLKVLDKLFSTDNDEKRQILSSGLEIVDKYKDNLFNSDILKDDIIAAKLYTDQSGMKVDTKTSTELKDQYNVLRNGKRLYDEVSALKDEELSRGLYDVGLQKVKQLFSDDTFNSNSPEEKAKILKSIDMNTKLGMFLAKYIKSISGAAVSDSEFARLRDLFNGSILNNTQTLKAGVHTFVAELDNQFKDVAKTNLLNDPATTLDVVRMYDKDIGKGFETTEQPIIAVNPRTGERLQLVNGKWEPVQ